MQSSYSNLSMVSDWTKGDPDVFTTNTSKPGWCNVDPDEAKRSAIVSMMDLGADSVSVRCLFRALVSINALGIAYAEVDFVSAPSVLYSIGDWPKWLRPAKVNILLLNLLVNIEAGVEKRGPLIHVYDLPPEYNSLLLELSSTLVLEEDGSG